MVQAPWFALPGAATLLYQPDFMGVLLVFILCMLALPALIRGIPHFGPLALLPSLVLYAAVPLRGRHLPGLGGLRWSSTRSPGRSSSHSAPGSAALAAGAWPT